MNKTSDVFKKGKAFIPFITGGDPELDLTERLIVKMAEAGADLIEIGIPFSDPVAEGPTIQKANARALASGTTTDGIFHMLERVREQTDIPLALMTYANPVFVYGAEKFMERAARAQVCALIVPDLPLEERGELLPFCQEYGIDLIPLIAPTSQERISSIAKSASGFVYCVSSLGVTGVREDFSSSIEEMVDLVKKASKIPCAVGFGVSTPDQAKKIASFADGVIVGSAIVQIIEEHGLECIPYVKDYIRKMKKAIESLES
ncbi:MAG: tryptophan synthase subunit alpha [Clostridiales bacterium]|nr:tryptophan synthase subunit alpha [Clostridiales bacterium]